MKNTLNLYDEENYQDYFIQDKTVFLKKTKNFGSLKNTFEFFQRHQAFLLNNFHNLLETEGVFNILFRQQCNDAIFDISFKNPVEQGKWYKMVLFHFANYYFSPFYSSLDNTEMWIIHDVLPTMNKYNRKLDNPDTFKEHLIIKMVQNVEDSRIDMTQRVLDFIKKAQWNPNWTAATAQQVFQGCSMAALNIWEKTGLDVSLMQAQLLASPRNFFSGLNNIRSEILYKCQYLKERGIVLEDLPEALFIEKMEIFINALPKNHFDDFMALLDLNHPKHLKAAEYISQIEILDENGGDISSHPLQRYVNIVNIFEARRKLEQTLALKSSNSRVKI